MAYAKFEISIKCYKDILGRPLYKDIWSLDLRYKFINRQYTINWWFKARRLAQILKEVNIYEEEKRSEDLSELWDTSTLAAGKTGKSKKRRLIRNSM